jgi:hypothetical protein
MAKKKSAQGKKSSTGLDGLAKLMVQARRELKAKLDAHEAAWGISKARWDVDQDEGIIVFSKPNGLTATAPVQIIGTLNRADGTWLWAWDNSSILPELQKHALQVKAHGLKRNLAELTSRKIACSEKQATGFVALACHLANAQGAYQGAMGDTLIFMTFGDVTLR